VAILRLIKIRYPTTGPCFLICCVRKEISLGQIAEVTFSQIREDIRKMTPVRTMYWSMWQPDGTAYYLRDDGTPWTDRPRATYETCRFAHSYVLGYLCGDLKTPDLALSAMKGLTGAAGDKENGGWYEGLNADGTPQDGKLCYTHAFVILAASSLLTALRKQNVQAAASQQSEPAAASQQPEPASVSQQSASAAASGLLKKAEDTYTRRFWDAESQMAYDNWDTAFTKLSPYRGLNANMHSVEAFLADFDVTANEEYHRRAKEVIDRVSAWASDNEWRIPEHYTDKWVPELEYNSDRPDDQFKPYGATPGHGIEWARLITQFGLSAYEDDPEQKAHYVDIAEHLFARAVSDAWDCDGAPGIVYTTDWSGQPIVHERMHWVLAEAINTSSVLYRVTKKRAYADWYSTFMEYLDCCVILLLHLPRDHQTFSIIRRNKKAHETAIAAS